MTPQPIAWLTALGRHYNSALSGVRAYVILEYCPTQYTQLPLEHCLYAPSLVEIAWYVLVKEAPLCIRIYALKSIFGATRALLCWYTVKTSQTSRFFPNLLTYRLDVKARYFLFWRS